METKFITKLPEVGDVIEGRVCAGWARVNTAGSGQLHVGFGTYHTEIVIKFLDYGRTVVATLVTKGRF